MISLSGLRHNMLDIGSLNIMPGITSVIGPNGSGKTTLLKCCAGITEPDAGTLLVDGQPPRDVEVGWVNEFPDRNILFETVEDEIASSLRFRRIPCHEIADRVHAHLAHMGILSLGDRPVRELSGGEKILVALAAALIHHPKVLVLDECDSYLDECRARTVDCIIRTSGTPYIIRCTQQMESAARGDSVIYLDQGRVLYNGMPQEVFTSLSGTSFYPLSMRCRI